MFPFQDVFLFFFSNILNKLVCHVMLLLLIILLLLLLIYNDNNCYECHRVRSLPMCTILGFSAKIRQHCQDNDDDDDDDDD